MPDFTQVRSVIPALDLEDERLADGDTTLATVKMNRAWDDITATASGINDTAADMQTLAAEMSDPDVLQGRVIGFLSFETVAGAITYGAPPTAPPAQELAIVWRDSTLGNNGIYGWDGATWIKTEGLASNAYDLAVIAGFAGTADEWLESLNGTNGQHANMRAYTHISSSEIVLDRTYSLQNVGDHIELYIRLPVNSEYAVATQLGWAGTQNDATQNFIGLLGATGSIITVKASSNDFLNFQLPLGQGRSGGGFDDWVRIRVEVSNANEIRVLRDGVQVDSAVSAVLPLDIATIGGGYTVDAILEIRELSIQSDEGSLQFLDPRLLDGVDVLGAQINFEEVDVRGRDGIDGEDGEDGEKGPIGPSDSAGLILADAKAKVFAESVIASNDQPAGMTIRVIASEGWEFDMPMPDSDEMFTVGLKKDLGGLTTIRGIDAVSAAKSINLIPHDSVLEFAINLESGNFVPHHGNAAGSTFIESLKTTPLTAIDATNNSAPNDRFVSRQTYLARDSGETDTLWIGTMIHVITPGKIEVLHTLDFKIDVPLSYGYLAMHPIVKPDVVHMDTPYDRITSFPPDAAYVFYRGEDRLLGAVAVRHDDYGVVDLIDTPSTILGTAISNSYDTFLLHRPNNGNSKLYWRAWRFPQTVTAGTRIQTKRTMSLIRYDD